MSRALEGEPDRRGSRGPEALLAALVFLGFHAALFVPYILSDTLYIPVTAKAAPPWIDLAHPPEEVQDWAGTDKLVYVYPNLVRWKQAVADSPGDLLWNPWVFGGYPAMAALDTHVFYPGNALLLVLDPADAFLANALLHGFLASFFAYLALGRLRVRWLARVLGGVAFGASGWFLVHHDIPNFAQAATWVPLGMLGADLAIAGQRRRLGVLVTALATAIGFLAGLPQITILGLLATGFLAFVRASLRAAPNGVRPGVFGLLRALAGVVLGVLLAAPQLVPTYEFQRRSARATFDPEVVRRAGMEPLELSGLWLPELLGTPPEIQRLQRGADPVLRPETTEGNFPLLVLAGAGGSGESFLERVFGGGLFAFACAIVGLIVHPRRSAVFLVLAVLGFLAAACSPVLDVLGRLPGVTIGNPRRFVFLVVLALPALTALGAEALFVVRRPRLVGAFAGVVVALPIAAVYGVAVFDPGLVVHALERAGIPAEAAATMPRWITEKTLLPLLLSLGTALLLVFARRVGTGASLALGLVLVVLPEALLLQLRCNPGQVRLPLFPPTGLTRWLVQQRGDLASAPQADASGLARIVRLKSPAVDHPAVASHPVALPPNLGSLYAIPDAQGYEALVDRRYEAVVDLVEPGLSVGHHAIRALSDPSCLDSPILDLLGVRWVLCSGQLARPPVFVNEQEAVAVYERPSALPRLFPPRRVEVLKDDAEVLSRMGARDFAPRDVAYLTEEEARGRLPAEGLSSPERVELRLLRYRPTEIRVAFATTAPTPVFLGDTADPAWTARLETGENLDVLTVNHAFRLVVLPPGKGILVFEYRPVTVRVGLAAAALAVLALAALPFLRGRGATAIPAP